MKILRSGVIFYKHFGTKLVNSLLVNLIRIHSTFRYSVKKGSQRQVISENLPRFLTKSCKPCTAIQDLFPAKILPRLSRKYKIWARQTSTEATVKLFQTADTRQDPVSRNWDTSQFYHLSQSWDPKLGTNSEQKTQWRSYWLLLCQFDVSLNLPILTSHVWFRKRAKIVELAREIFRARFLQQVFTCSASKFFSSPGNISQTLSSEKFFKTDVFN